MDKTNDKLPDEQIKADAKLYDQSYYTHLSQHSHKTPADHYIAGATAWASWKVRYDELNMRKAGEVAELKLKLFDTFENNEQLQAQAQRMADALELIANAPLPANENERLSWIYTARNLANENLQQFKDGKEVEEEDREINPLVLLHNPQK